MSPLLTLFVAKPLMLQYGLLGSGIFYFRKWKSILGDLLSTSLGQKTPLKSWYIFTKPHGVILERLISILLTMRTENLTKQFEGLKNMGRSVVSEKMLGHPEMGFVLENITKRALPHRKPVTIHNLEL
jgi:hypothetical protein